MSGKSTQIKRLARAHAAALIEVMVKAATGNSRERAEYAREFVEVLELYIEAHREGES